MTKRAYISQILLLLSSFASMSQSSNKNYVMTLSPLSASVPWSPAVFDKDGNINVAPLRDNPRFKELLQQYSVIFN